MFQAKTNPLLKIQHLYKYYNGKKERDTESKEIEKTKEIEKKKQKRENKRDKEK